MAIKVPGKGPLPARIMIVGEAPGADEEQKGEPFVGVSGRFLDQCLSSVGIARNICYVTNVVKYRPPQNKIDQWFHIPDKPKKDGSAPKKAVELGLDCSSNGAWYNSLVAEGVQELIEEIERCQPEVIIAAGNTPLWALTGETGISKWRGSELQYGTARLIPVFHPAAVLRQMELKYLLMHDLRVRVVGKAGVVQAVAPEATWRFTTGRSYETVMQALHDLGERVRSGQVPLSVDIETKRGRIDCVGIAWSERDAICVPFLDTSLNPIWTERQLREVVEALRCVLTAPAASIIGQNFNYDAQYFLRDPAFGFRVVCWHDTKVAQHILLPGTDKDLVTLSSLYCEYHCYWKDDLKESADNLDDEKRWRYNCRDCCVTYEVAMKQIPMLKKEGFL